jgi:5-carboxymethyl-2-hydroxymuconic-semialdehyde dehydrogenase
MNTQARPSATARALRYGVQEHFIGGVFVPSVSGETFASLNPSTNAVLALAAAGDAVDVDAAVGAARRAFDEGGWPRLKAAERAAVLRRIAEGIRMHAEEFIAREVADIGMPVA